jgi:hypothetical protein
MNVSVQSTVSSALLSIGEASERFNVHPNTLRHNAAAGKLKVFTLPSGHRRFAESDLLAWLGYEQGNGEGENKGASTSQPVKIAKVIRVSSYAQSVKQGNAETSSLENQSVRCDEFIKERFGDNVEVTEYCRAISGTQPLCRNGKLSVPFAAGWGGCPSFLGRGWTEVFGIWISMHSVASYVTK